MFGAHFYSKYYLVVESVAIKYEWKPNIIPTKNKPGKQGSIIKTIAIGYLFTLSPKVASSSFRPTKIMMHITIVVMIKTIKDVRKT